MKTFILWDSSNSRLWVASPVPAKPGQDVTIEDAKRLVESHSYDCCLTGIALPALELGDCKNITDAVK